MTTSHPKRFRFASLTLAGAALLSGSVLAACSSSDNPNTDAAAVTTAPEAAPTSAVSDMDHQSTAEVSAETELYTAMRGLWDEHMEWTWSTAAAFATESPGLQPTIDRLLQNQEDIGKALSAYYGDEAGDKATELLKEHITDAVPVLEAAKAGDEAALEQALDAWYANAQEIGDFLASANPDNWDQADMREMMKTHITQTTDYAAAAISGDWTKAIASYDEAQSHMAEMSDMLSAGIIAQFPDKF